MRGLSPAALLVVATLGVPPHAAAQPHADDGVVRFVWADTTARAVSLGGDFNGWSPTATPLDREAGVWLTRVFLDPGTYEYKFMVDGAWRTDAVNPEVSVAGNSVVRVGADGAVLPPHASPVAPGGAAAAPAGALAWQLRYLGFVTARRDRGLDRYDLDRPLHDVDLRLDARLDLDAEAWLLLHADNRSDDAALVWDRGLLSWRPGSFTVRAFDDVGVAEFDDPAVLVGRVGRYADAFGYGRRGAHVRRRVLGAPFEILYADDSEPGVNRAPATALPDLHGPDAAALVGQRVVRYAAAASDRGADTGALRARLGTDRAGLGVGLRVDRGANAGRLAEVDVARLAGDTLVATGRELGTSETWRAWAIDARTRVGAVRVAGELQSGILRARATDAAPVVRLRAAPGDTATARELGSAAGNSAGFDLDASRRVVLQVDGGGAAREPEIWSARPGTGAVGGRRLRYEYEEHDLSALVTGAPFLMRRHAVTAGADAHAGGVTARLDVEHHWFRIPAEAVWATQFWLRSGNPWLEEDVAGIDRVTLLGTRTAALVRLHAGGLVWPARRVRFESHSTWAAPGFDRAPRHVEEILRFAVPLASKLELRTHSRLAVYRRFEPRDAAGVARLGAGARIEAGDIDLGGVAVRRSTRTFGAHFVECVYALSPRSDLALGFGVDPWIVYETTNEYAPIGWDEFLFDRIGRDLSLDPAALGRRIEAAERALERERRLTLEARLRF
jgi:hypothetical protein